MSTPARGRPSNSPLRVLAQPAFRNREVNAYNTLLYTAVVGAGAVVEEWTTRRAVLGRYDVVHLHWPDSPLNMSSQLRVFQHLGLRLLGVWAARRRGAVVVWTAHNLRSHDQRRPAVERWFWSCLLPLVDGVIALSHEGVRLVHERHPKLVSVPVTVVPHGHYRDAYLRGTTRQEARDHLGIPPTAQVLALVGRIRPYKDVPALLRAVAELPSESIEVLVAGDCPDSALRAELERSARADRRVHLHLRRVPDDELRIFLTAADLVVLPFRAVLNSGSALLALSFDRPVLARRFGALPELAQAVGDGWVKLYDGPLNGAVLEQALADLPAGAPDLGVLEWDAIGERTLAFYQRLQMDGIHG